jgi:hypothetical protein
MKKEVLNLVFYLVCFIVLLLFAAMFFNWKSLEGFREGADEVAAATTDSSAATSGNTVATSGNTVVTSTDTTVPVSSTTTTGTTYVASDSTGNTSTSGTTYVATDSVSTAATTGTTYVATDSVSTAATTGTTYVAPVTTTYVAPETTGNASVTSSTVVATPVSTISTNPSCNTIIGDDKLGVYLKPKNNHVYPIVYTTSPDTCTLAHFILENGKQVQSIDNGKNAMVYFSPTTAVVGGMAYGKFCTETNNAKTKLPITYTSNTLQVKYDKTDYYVVFINDAGKYVSAMRRIGDSNLAPNMIRTICQTLK